MPTGKTRSAAKKSRAGRKKPARKRARKAAKPQRKERFSEFEFDDSAVERALQSGDHAGILEDYFGAESYRELRHLAQEAAARSVRGGPRVLILPGIMGSKLGIRSDLSPLFDDVYWFDPVDIVAGRLPRLELDSGADRFEALGVILLAYLKLKLRLRIAGFDADFHPFDWRQSLSTLGRQLSDRLARQDGSETSLVCHSMGGLVARAALAQGARCRRLVMLGTPNFGSFAAVMALRATNSVVRKVGFLDPFHSAEELAVGVFSSFPGLTQMLPFPEKYDEIDLFSLSEWPTDRLRPREAILRQARAAQRALAPADSRFFLIAGVNQETVTHMTRQGGEFAYEHTLVGDGTVPLEFALLEGAKTYYLEESHGSLPNNGAVARAVEDILNGGETDRLADSWEPPRRAREVRSDSDLRIEPYGQRRGGGLSRSEVRHLLQEFASPTAREMPPPAAARPTPSAVLSASDQGYGHQFDGVVVGRRQQHRLDLRFALGSITEVDARALALGIFRDVTPGGAANAVDRSLNGAITELTQRRMFSGNVGEIFMLPTRRHRLATEVVAFVGLGPFDRFDDEVLKIAAENTLRTFINSRVEEFATVLMGAGSGGSAGRSLRGLLTGFLTALLDADRDHHFRRVIICELDPCRYDEMKAELFRLSSTPLCEQVEITFDEIRLPEARPVAIPPRLARPRTETTYLIVRQERSTNTELDVRTSVLTAGSKATVVTGVQTLSKTRLKKLVDNIADHRGADFSALGRDLAELALAPEVREVLPSQQKRHLIVVHDAPMSRIPWEVLSLPGPESWSPAAGLGMSHLYAAENLSVAKWLEQRVQYGKFRLLLVVNPTGDLAGAVAEGRAVRELLRETPAANFDELRESQATHQALLTAFASGSYDVIHYAGHAFFDERNPERSGILCHREIPLTGADLAGLGNLPTLVFFNACESARVRRPEQLKPATRSRRFRDNLESGVGLAEAFMRGGIANFVGTYWPVGDQPAEQFARVFYSEILRGKTMNDALQAGRAKIREDLGSKDWANYIHYGSPDFVIKKLESPE